MKKFAAFVIFAGAAGLCFSQTKEEDIVRLLELTDSKNMAVQIFDMVIPQIARIAPNVPQSVWDALKDKMDFDVFVKNYIPIYDRHYTHEDIRELIEFYESPVGRKVIRVTPAMTEESMQMGQSYGAILAEEILRELKKGGYLDA
jgi:hypothetical protein